MRSLTIIPCAQRKIWSKQPNAGPTPAADAYISAAFKLNRQYAEAFGDHWLILSARYGLIEPDFLIPGPYDVSFNRPSSGPITIPEVQAQVQNLGLHAFPTIVALGGKAYRNVLIAALAPHPIQFPFAGLPIGKAMQAVKLALEKGST